MKRLLLAFVLLMLPLRTASAADSPVSYYVPPPQFSAALQVMDLGFANVFAIFQNATGSFSFDEGAKSLSRLRLALDTSSLMSSNSGSQRDLANLLGTMQYSEIRVTAPDSVTFADGKAEVKATLTLHGTAKPVTFEATLNHVGKSPRGGGMWSSEGDAVGLSLRGSIKRADFGMTDDPETPSRFGDTMTLMLEMQGLRQ
jgi:polyisoprenoid-binding protein YceI